MNDYLSTDFSTKIDGLFLLFLEEKKEGLAKKLVTFRESNSPIEKEKSSFLISLAIHLEKFIALFFDISPHVNSLQERTLIHDPVMAFKK
ncbi:hypothetical protein, partial [Acidithiobacillus caldus]